MLSLWGGSGTLPLNLKIQAGGLHPLHPHSTKRFPGRAGEGEWRKGEGSAGFWSQKGGQVGAGGGRATGDLLGAAAPNGHRPGESYREDSPNFLEKL